MKRGRDGGKAKGGRETGGGAADVRWLGVGLVIERSLVRLTAVRYRVN